MKLQKDLRKFIESLNALDVRFLVVALRSHITAISASRPILISLSTALSKRRTCLQAVQQLGFADLKLTVEDFSQEDQVSSLAFLQTVSMS